VLKSKITSIVYHLHLSTLLLLKQTGTDIFVDYFLYSVKF